YVIHYFFFSSRRRHTRSKRDWSSDVCSSDLSGADRDQGRREGQGSLGEGSAGEDRDGLDHGQRQTPDEAADHDDGQARADGLVEIGRASCRERRRLKEERVRVQNELDEGEER